ncbi:hypothetical protein ACQJBY_012784 [Aegilops geniculata]
MHPYLHEYYSVQKFKAAYASPIPALTNQSQWPEVEIEFTLCPPVTRRKAGRPKQSRFKAWFEKGGCSKKGKKEKEKNDKPKRAQKGNKNRCKLCEVLGHRIGSSKCIYTPQRPKRKRAEKAPPLVVEQCWPVKKARLNGYRRKSTKRVMFGDKDMELTETVTAEHELSVSVLDDVMHTESVLQTLGQSEIVADEATVVLPCESALTTVLPCLEVVLPSFELQTEVVEQCVPSTQSAEVQTEEVGLGQVQKLRGPSGVCKGPKSKSISINKLCAMEPNGGKKQKKSSGRKKQKK